MTQVQAAYLPSARIMADYRRNALDMLEAVDYRWDGEQDCALLGIQFGEHKRGDLVILGDLRLRVVSDPEMWAASVWVMRDGWRARWRAAWYPIPRLIWTVYQRSLVTLAIWGLATLQRERTMSWRDIKGIRRFSRH